MTYHAVTCGYNLFVPNASFFYPLKTSENRKVSEGREKVQWENMG